MRLPVQPPLACSPPQSPSSCHQPCLVIIPTAPAQRRHAVPLPSLSLDLRPPYSLPQSRDDPMSFLRLGTSLLLGRRSGYFGDITHIEHFEPDDSLLGACVVVRVVVGTAMSAVRHVEAVIVYPPYGTRTLGSRHRSIEGGHTCTHPDPSRMRLSTACPLRRTSGVHRSW